MNEADPAQAVVHTDYGDVLPACADLAGAAVEMIGVEDREHQLKTRLDALRDDYDMIFIDCPPSLELLTLNGLCAADAIVVPVQCEYYALEGLSDALRDDYDMIFIDCPPSLELLTLNGLCAADAIVVPVQCEYYALEGLSDLMTTLRMVKRRLNPRLELFGVILTMYDGRTNFSNQVAQEVRRHMPGKVFANVIPRNVRLAEAPSHGIPVMNYDRSSRGSQAYKLLAEEFLGKI